MKKNLRVKMKINNKNQYCYVSNILEAKFIMEVLNEIGNTIDGCSYCGIQELINNNWTEKNKLRVCWCTLINNKQYTVRYYVYSIDEAVFIINTLTQREKDDNIKFDAYSLEELCGDKWCKWYNAKGDDINSYIRWLSKGTTDNDNY